MSINRFIHNEIVKEEKKQKIYIFNTYFMFQMRKKFRDQHDDIRFFHIIYDSFSKVILNIRNYIMTKI